MLFRQFQEYEYLTLVSWWKHYGDWGCMPYEYLPETSFVVTNCDNKILAFASLYLTNSPFAVIEWITADPSLSKEEKNEALDFLISNVHNVAGNEHGCKMLQTSTRIKPLIERLKNNHKYFDHDHNLTALLAAINYEEVSKSL